jgi:hypothetical protein
VASALLAVALNTPASSLAELFVNFTQPLPIKESVVKAAIDPEVNADHPVVPRAKDGL